MARPNHNPHTRIAQYDSNGLSLSTITIVQARHLVLSGSAVPMNGKCTGELPGWRDRAWRDWPAIQMLIPRKETKSPCAITSGDAVLNAGAGDYKQVQRAQAKVTAWPTVGDTKAVRVGVRA